MDLSPVNEPPSGDADDFASIMVSCILRSAGPPKDLVSRLQRPLSYDVQEAICGRIQAINKLPDATYLQRLIEAIVELNMYAPSSPDGEFDVHDAWYELVQTAASVANSGGGHVSYFLHPVLQAHLASGVVGGNIFPLVSVWRSTVFSDISSGVWPAALNLIQAIGLACHPPTTTASDSDSLHARWCCMWRGRHVLELGAGTGLAGLAAAALSRARSGSPAYADARDEAGKGMVSSLCLTDCDPKSVALMARNARESGFLCSLGDSVTARSENSDTGGVVVHSCRLDWTELASTGTLPAGMQQDEGSASCYDAIIASDVVYDPAAVGPLVATLGVLLGGTAGSLASGNNGPTRKQQPGCDSIEELLDYIAPSGSTAATAAKPRPFALLANTYRNPSTYALLEAALSQQQPGLRWRDVTAEVEVMSSGSGTISDVGVGGVSGRSRPVLDLRLPGEAVTKGAPPAAPPLTAPRSIGAVRMVLVTR